MNDACVFVIILQNIHFLTVVIKDLKRKKKNP